VVQIQAGVRGPARSDARRAEILRRAAAAFRDEGFHAAGMREIARAAGMTPGNLYYYFENKDDLLYACQRRTLERLLRDARAIAAGEGGPEDRLRALVRAHVLCLLEETGGSAAHLEFRALPAPRRAEIARRRDAYERVVRGVIAQGVRCGAFRAVEPKLAALAVLGAVNATVTWWRPEGPLAPAAIADAFADTLVGGLLP
jgi:AcrR family transcriptional regulator